MNEKIAIAFDEQSKEILNNIYPELRNAAVNIAVKMLAKDPMYLKYFCSNCEATEEEITELENLATASAAPANQAAAQQPQQASNVVTWDEF